MKLLIFMGIAMQVCSAIAFVAAWHVSTLPTAAQRFGCEKNYINERGEDTGECY